MYLLYWYSESRVDQIGVWLPCAPPSSGRSRTARRTSRSRTPGRRPPAARRERDRQPFPVADQRAPPRQAYPAARRAPRSQATVERQRTRAGTRSRSTSTRRRSPGTARPPTRHQRMPSAGPASSAPPSSAAAAAILARERSRSITRQPNAASTQNITKMSSIAVRLITSSSPSRASSSPATQPSRVDLVIRRAIRAVIRMASEPTTATENRQPNGVRPNSHSPGRDEDLAERRVHDELAAGGRGCSSCPGASSALAF